MSEKVLKTELKYSLTEDLEQSKKKSLENETISFENNMVYNNEEDRIEEKSE